jgi:uncharacterized membrane protein
MGILNVAGYYVYLQALSHGPLSLVTVITSMHFAVGIILSILIYRERLTAMRFAGIALTIVSLALIHS